MQLSPSGSDGGQGTAKKKSGLFSNKKTRKIGRNKDTTEDGVGDSAKIHLQKVKLFSGGRSDQVQ